VEPHGTRPTTTKKLLFAMKRLITNVAKIFTCSHDAGEAAHTHTVRHYNNAAQACRTERKTNKIIIIIINMFENGVLRRIFGLKRDEVTGE
jgi:hypothetical protein